MAVYIIIKQHRNLNVISTSIRLCSWLTWCTDSVRQAWLLNDLSGWLHISAVSIYYYYKLHHKGLF